ncbi:MAG: 4-hydroxy-3-methylbut-2-enyl diphosphate reductase, partial [Nitrospirota bacterium]
MKIYLANPRGFCAGVDRAIEIVDLSLKTYGAPIYVRHEIVHSRHVVESLRGKGAIFVEELNEVPDGSIVIFSAHGVAKAVWEESKRRNLKVIDATCPLVIKVHNEVNRDYANTYELILIGHAGHPEVVGTLGQVPDKFHLVSSVEDVETLEVENPLHLSYVTQTTLSVDECRDIVAALHQRFPGIKGPHQEDICYATQNRQNAVKELSRFVDVILVIGSPNSSNSNRLRELGERCGITSYLIDSFQDIQISWLEGANAVGIAAGASAPEVLVSQVIKF